MKKVIKGILISVIVLIIIYIILVLTKVLPNPFLDTKDLVCTRETKLPGYVEQEIVIIKFNKDATIKEYDEIYKIIYEDVKELNNYKDYLTSINVDYRYNEVEKSIETKELIKITQKNNYYKKTKKEMKNIFLNEIHYEKCD